jgi:hypothetical protein
MALTKGEPEKRVVPVSFVQRPDDPTTAGWVGTPSLPPRPSPCLHRDSPGPHHLAQRSYPLDLEPLSLKQDPCPSNFILDVNITSIQQCPCGFILDISITSIQFPPQSYLKPREHVVRH